MFFKSRKSKKKEKDSYSWRWNTGFFPQVSWGGGSLSEDDGKEEEPREEILLNTGHELNLKICVSFKGLEFEMKTLELGLGLESELEYKNSGLGLGLGLGLESKVG